MSLRVQYYRTKQGAAMRVPELTLADHAVGGLRDDGEQATHAAVVHEQRAVGRCEIHLLRCTDGREESVE